LSQALPALALIVAASALAAAGLALARKAEPPTAGGGTGIEARLPELEARLAALELRAGPGTAAAARDVGAAGAGAGGGASTMASGGGERREGTPPAEEPLRALVRAVVAEEFEVRKGSGEAAAAAKAPPGGEKKPSLAQFGALLDLDEGQRSAVQAAVVKGQEEMIALLRTPTAGGRVPLDELLDALLGKPEEMQPRMIEIFTLLGTEKVPGGGETYGQRSEALKRGVSESFRRQFRAEQFQEYERMGQDPLEIQVPDSPWIEVLRQAVERRK
jgi:hypothetical protein